MGLLSDIAAGKQIPGYTKEDIERETAEFLKEEVYIPPTKSVVSKFDNQLNVFKKSISEIVSLRNIYKIILFGSVARNTYNEDSDIDIMIITDKMEFSEEMNFDTQIENILRNNGADMLPELQLSYSYMEEWLKEYKRPTPRSAFLEIIMREGVILWQKN